LFGQFHGAGHGGLVAAVHDHVAPGHIRSRGQVLVVDLGAHKSLDAVHLECSRYKGADARGNEHAAGQQWCALRGFDQQPPVSLYGEGGHQCVQVPLGFERRNLLEQQTSQLAPGTDRDARDVVDGLVAVQLDALAARMGQGVDQVGGDALQAQLEDLEQAHGARADDNGIGLLNHAKATRAAPETGAAKDQCHRGTGFARPLVASPWGDDAKRRRGVT